MSAAKVPTIVREPHVRVAAQANGADAREAWESGPPPGFDEDEPAQTTPPAPPPWEALVTPLDPEWTKKPPPARDWLLRDIRRPKRDGVLPMGKAAQIVAEGGVGKTMAMIQLAIAKSTGSEWLGTFSTGAPGKSLVLLGEEDTPECWRRSYNATRGKDARLPPAGSIVLLPLFGVHCTLLEHDERGNAVETAFCTWLREYVTRERWSLIIFDPLSRFAGPDTETDNAQGTRFVQVIESFATVTGATCLVAHHTNGVSRAPGAAVRGGRGVTSLGDGFRWVASMVSEDLPLEGEEERERLGEVVTVRSVKTNYSRKFEPLMLRRLDGGPFVPLDESDRERVNEARTVDPARNDKRRARDAEREAIESAEDAAVLQVVREQPGVPLRDLVKRVQGLAHCGPNRAEVAISRMRDRLDVREGPRKAQLHYPRGTDA